jgi:signal transduction histidine kinase
MATDFLADIASIQQIDAVPKILEVVCRTTGLTFAAVARVTEDRWIACSVKDDAGFGLQVGGELEIETTFCNEIRQHGQAIVIDEVASDEDYCGHHIPARYGIQSYISVPIVRPDGTFFGTLCALDRRPARLKTPGVIGMFKLFAELIGFHLDAIERLAASQKALLDERKEVERRERFIAVLGHDLRNPLTAIDAEASALLQLVPDGNACDIADAIKISVRRMSAMINEVLDFTRGHLGTGLPLFRDSRESLESVLDDVIVEMRAIFPERTIDKQFRLKEPVSCDRTRIS